MSAAVTETALLRVRSARRAPRRRLRVVCSALVVVLVAVVCVRLTLGDFVITLPDVVRIIGGREIPGASYILMESKLPRALTGLLVGSAFGVAGAIFQTTLRNPLASPDLVGVSTGASAAAVVAIVPLGLTGPAVSVAAVLGAVAVAIGVRLAVGPHPGHRLVLVGVGVSALMLAVVQYLFTRADIWDAQLLLQWLNGSLNRTDWPTLRILVVAWALLIGLVVTLARSTRATELGDDLAAGLGVPARRADALLLVAVVLTAVGVAATGPLAFVAFLSGPIARALNGGRSTLLGAGLVGAIVVVAADHVAAYAVPDINYPVGVVTGAIGAPFLLWLLATGRTTGRTR